MTAVKFLALSGTAGLCLSRQSYAQCVRPQSLLVCVCVCWKCQGLGLQCAGGPLTHVQTSTTVSLVSNTHTQARMHIPEADQSIVEALQWAPVLTYIKMSPGYRAAPEDPLLSVYSVSTHTQMHWGHSMYTLAENQQCSVCMKTGV